MRCSSVLGTVLAALLGAFLASDLSRYTLVPYGLGRIEGVLSNVSQTAFVTANIRCLGHSLGYVDDPTVKLFMPWKVRLHSMLAFPRHYILGNVYDPSGTFGWVVARTNIIDSFVHKGLTMDGTTPSLIILGAGFDTRPYRLDLGPSTPVFEVDTAPTQRAKRQILKEHGIDTSGVTFVEMDFNGDETFVTSLEKHGFQQSNRAVIIWEGVIPYLQEQAVNATLEMVAGLAKGTILITTFVNEVPSSKEELSRVYGGRIILDKIAGLGEPSTFQMPKGKEEEFMQSFGFNVLAHLDADSMEQKYFRDLQDDTRVGGLYNIMALQVA